MSLLYISNANQNKEQEEQICIGGEEGEIHLYQIQQQIKTTTTKLLQIFPLEHPSSYDITSLLQLNPNTIVSSAWSSSNSSDSNVIVVWSKLSSKSSSSPLYEPLQRITQKETGRGINDLVILKQKKEEEGVEEFASCSSWDKSIIIWRQEKGGESKDFRLKQKITNVGNVSGLFYISITNELISGSGFHLQIWSQSSSSSDFAERQTIQISSSPICSLCQINENNNNDSKRIEFASGHRNGQIKIWSKQQQPQINYSLLKTLKPFDNDQSTVWDLTFINDNGFNCLISCSLQENKIKIFKGEEEEEVLEHKGVRSLVPMSNGQFASGGGYDNGNLNIWSPSSSSS